MARRSAPPGSGPAYLTPANYRQERHPADETAFGRFMRQEIWAPEKLPGNIHIVTSLAMFVGGIVVARKWGMLFAPA